jgi:hypothetical protein
VSFFYAFADQNLVPLKWIISERNPGNKVTGGLMSCKAMNSPVMTKCPKSQNCRPTYFFIVASVIMELESVSNENFES